MEACCYNQEGGTPNSVVADLPTSMAPASFSAAAKGESALTGLCSAICAAPHMASSARCHKICTEGPRMAILECKVKCQAPDKPQKHASIAPRACAPVTRHAGDQSAFL